MLKKYKRLLLPLLFLGSLGTLGYLIYAFSPETSFTFFFIHIPILLLFFPLLMLFVFSLVAIITKRPVFGWLVAALVLLYLFLRMAGLTHPFFLFLLIALFITFLLLFKKEK